MSRLDRKSAAEKFAERAVEGEAVKEQLVEQSGDLEGDLRVDATGRQASVEPDGFVDDDTFDQFRDAVSNNRAISYRGGSNDVYSSRVDEDSAPPNPYEVHESRSEYAQQQDETRDARITTSPRQYASDPDSYDFPGVDTGPRFESTFGSDPSSSSLEKIQETASGERESGSLGDLFNF